MSGRFLIRKLSMRRESIVAPFFGPLEKVVTFEIVAGTLCHFSVVNHSSFGLSSKFFLSFLVFYFSFFKSALCMFTSDEQI